MYIKAQKHTKGNRKMYEIIICDDNEGFIKYMERMLLEGGLALETVNFYEYKSGERLVEKLPEHAKVDLLILDMQMEGLDGNQTAKRFRKQFPLSLLVFCSGVCQPTVTSFEVLPFRYLLKEYTDKRMLEEIKNVIEELKNRAEEIYVVGHYYKDTIRLKPEEITYISIAKHGSQIHTNSKIMKYELEDKIMCKQKVDELYDKLKAYGFAYAHNSYIVNLRYVKRISATELELQDNVILSISRSKEKNFRADFAKYLAGKYI